MAKTTQDFSCKPLRKSAHRSATSYLMTATPQNSTWTQQVGSGFDVDIPVQRGDPMVKSAAKSATPCPGVPTAAALGTAARGGTNSHRQATNTIHLSVGDFRRFQHPCMLIILLQDKRGGTRAIRVHHQKSTVPHFSRHCEFLLLKGTASRSMKILVQYSLNFNTIDHHQAWP